MGGPSPSHQGVAALAALPLSDLPGFPPVRVVVTVVTPGGRKAELEQCVTCPEGSRRDPGMGPDGQVGDRDSPVAARAGNRQMSQFQGE